MPVSAAKVLPPGTLLLEADFHASLLFLRCCSLLSLASSSEVSPFHKLSFVRATPPEYLPHDKKPATSGAEIGTCCSFLPIYPKMARTGSRLVLAFCLKIKERKKNWFVISVIAHGRILVYFTSFWFKYLALTAFNRKRSTSTSLLMRIASKYFALMVSCPLGRPSEGFELAP